MEQEAQGEPRLDTRESTAVSVYPGLDPGHDHTQTRGRGVDLVDHQETLLGNGGVGRVARLVGVGLGVGRGV